MSDDFESDLTFDASEFKHAVDGLVEAIERLEESSIRVTGTNPINDERVHRYIDASDVVHITIEIKDPDTSEGVPWKRK